MSAPDYIPLGGSDSEDSNSSTLGKRKYKTPTPDPDTRERKRLRVGKRPSRISSGRSGSSSPLSSVPSENVPTQLGFNILRAQREAHAAGYGLDYHRYALDNLKNSIQSYKDINADGHLDDDAISYLLRKLEENVNAKYGQTMTIFPPTTPSPTNTESSEIAAENSEIDLESLFGKDFEKLDDTTEAATNNTNTTNPPSPAAACTYKSTATNTGTEPTKPSYTEASTQTTPIPPPSNTTLWRRQLRFIRRLKRTVPANCPVTVVKCQLRKVQKRGPKSPQPAAARPRSPINLCSPQLSLPPPPASPTAQRKKPAPVTIDLLSSDDEEEAKAPPKKHINSNNDKNHELPPSAFRVGGAGYRMYDDSDDDDLPLIIPKNTEQGSASASASASAANGHHNPDNDTTHHSGQASSVRSSSSLMSQSDMWEQEMRQEDVRMISFYGLPRAAPQTVQGQGEAQGPSAAQRRQLRYQDNRDRYTGPKPGPQSGHQLRLKAYHEDIGSMHRRDPGVAIEAILERTSWGGVYDDYPAPAPASDEDDGDTNDNAHHDAELQRWFGSSCEVMRGFPLMEEVRFLVAGNHGTPNGDCYWRALSMHLYGGTGAHWDLVKAEHLAFVHHVLGQPRHPRHGLYARELNARFVATASPAAGGSFRANLWQTLHLAHAWTPALMQQVTADLYNVCVVTFSVKEREIGEGEGGGGGGQGSHVIIDGEEDGAAERTVVHEVTETTMRGSYNSRHLFLVYTNDCHYQPMIPADYYASEFQYPLPTPADTAKYRFAPKAAGGSAVQKGALEHAWRREFTATAPLPVPRLHGCDVGELRYYMGSRRQYH
ncbi:hypothetical protein SLS62_009772 [Diatrype stigma]|uniref:OTU domain-containing protein n=1 Tax=Diatrype stigma TaxID=117547 RepID=A0AAN9YKF2_9PEZI